jgi:hypothetical protein
MVYICLYLSEREGRTERRVRLKAQQLPKCLVLHKGRTKQTSNSKIKQKKPSKQRLSIQKVNTLCGETCLGLRLLRPKARVYDMDAPHVLSIYFESISGIL